MWNIRVMFKDKRWRGEIIQELDGVYKDKNAFIDVFIYPKPCKGIDEIINSNLFIIKFFLGDKRILPKKATRNVTLAALLIEEVTRTLTNK